MSADENVLDCFSMFFDELRKLGLTDAYEECSEVGYDLNLNERLNGACLRMGLIYICVFLSTPAKLDVNFMSHERRKKCQRYLNYVKVVLIVDHQNSQDIVRLVALVVSLYKKERK